MKERKVKVNVDPQGKISECRSCGASIRWGKTLVTGRMCPADAEPIDGHYYSHFESCPNATNHSYRSRMAKAGHENRRARKAQAERENFDKWNRGNR